MAEAHPTAHRTRSARSRPLGAAVLGLLALGASMHGTPLLIYNASASAPIGFYRVLPRQRLHLGDLLVATAPEPAQLLAAERGYLPRGVPLVKRVAALPGDRVCSEGEVISINNAPVAFGLAEDRAGRPLPGWRGCQVLGPREIFLLMADVTDSFDSRYFGPVTTDAVIGRLVPLWIQKH